MDAARFEVSGRVQGVGYRAFVDHTARALKLRGWVRNRSDDSVEVAALGEAAALLELERRLLAGPPAARVERVLRSPWRLAPAGQAALSGFEIAPDAEFVSQP